MSHRYRVPQSAVANVIRFHHCPSTIKNQRVKPWKMYNTSLPKKCKKGPKIIILLPHKLSHFLQARFRKRRSKIPMTTTLRSPSIFYGDVWETFRCFVGCLTFDISSDSAPSISFDIHEPQRGSATLRDISLSVKFCRKKICQTKWRSNTKWRSRYKLWFVMKIQRDLATILM